MPGRLRLADPASVPKTWPTSRRPSLWNATFSLYVSQTSTLHEIEPARVFGRIGRNRIIGRPSEHLHAFIRLQTPSLPLIQEPGNGRRQRRRDVDVVMGDTRQDRQAVLRHV
jgi:hypothetical protein